jgi:hypothetical protein
VPPHDCLGIVLAIYLKNMILIDKKETETFPFVNGSRQDAKFVLWGKAAGV